MIRTGGKIKSIGKITVTDDVCHDNFDIIRCWYTDCSLYINKRFEVPMNNYVCRVSHNNKTIADLSERINDLKQDRKFNETQIKNLELKFNYWIHVAFENIIREIDLNTDNIKILIHSDVSKHEWIFVKWLRELGVNFYIISKDQRNIEFDNEFVTQNNYGTNVGMNYTEDKKAEVKVANSFNSIRDVEQALYIDNAIVKVAVIGMSNYIDTCDFYGKLNKQCGINSKFKLCLNGFENPTQEEINQIPRFSSKDREYIINTLLLNIKNGEEEVKEIIKEEFNSGENKSLQLGILGSKLLYTVIIINRILSAGYTHIIYYGNVGKNSSVVLSILSKISNISVVIAMSDKNMFPNSLRDDIYVLELESSSEYFDMPTVDSRVNARTQGAIAQQIVDDTFYDGSILGMYKPGMFSKCKAVLFSTAYHEIEAWWNKEMYLRPGFKTKGIAVQIPVMFKVINGVPSDSPYQQYLSNIQALLYGNTILCRNIQEFRSLTNSMAPMRILHGTDVNGTSFSSQVKFFNRNTGRLDKNAIRLSRNYTYKFLADNKQDLILSKIEELLNSNFIHKQGLQDEDYVDIILGRLLNIGDVIIKIIQWFEFYTDNPNLVITLTDENMLDIGDMVMIMFMHMIGFDVVIYVPTCYKSISGLVTANFQYDTHNIGQAMYNMNMMGLRTMSKAECDMMNQRKEKKSFFDKLKDFI